MTHATEAPWIKRRGPLGGGARGSRPLDRVKDQPRLSGIAPRPHASEVSAIEQTLALDAPARCDALRYIPMADVDTNVIDNADAPWNRFSPRDYWRRNYQELDAEDREIVALVGHFLASAFTDRPHAQRAIDVGSGTNLYPALPRFDLGTMFFVAESITNDPGVFRDAVEHFVVALRPDAPFAAAFMAGSAGYEVADTAFPALAITPDDVRRHLTELGMREPRAELLETKPEVRDGYAGMIVATGFASNRRLGRGS
jgi:hypothetical protein